MRSAVLLLVVVAVAALSGACSSSEKDVKTNYMTQWTSVAANTQATTDAAKAVLEGEGLKDVTASATNVDGTATGKKADGTKVKVSVKKVKDTSSEVSVNVGTMGDPSLGADIARKIKDKAEMK
jgi:Zn-dependent membrane protease YugP